MSDSMRQSTTDKVSSSMKPDSQKSTMEKGTDSVKGAADSVAGKAQPGTPSSPPPPFPTPTPTHEPPFSPPSTMASLLTHPPLPTDSEKSTTQSMSDSVSGGSSDASKSASDTAGKAQEQGGSMMNQASETLSNVAGQAQDALGMGSTFQIPPQNPSGGCRC
ncbi:hypothetical protein LTR59_008376 [Friedmanniomyces endolithicus]|nr:hypothetical protein LTR59_008376 [Friedmanniomyces endolithicus]KAK0798696.1 hypothetical protein LTR38_007785 [Friedmanniomyces endolithicus]KAK0854794.1 hypothetical protein LTR03_002228 [Friedmanniomyces endolithicus]